MKKEDVEKVLKTLREQRDELKVKIHSAKAEAADEWAVAEKKWLEMKPKLEAMTTTSGEIAKEIGTTIKDVSADILAGYERISNLLK